MSKVILPGAAIGILGSGQLGRMLALIARRMGYRIHVFSPGEDTPTGQIADKEICASYDDLAAVQQFASEVDVVTYEFENVPSATAQAVTALRPLHPGAQVLHVAQNRLREKQFLQAQDLPVAAFVAVDSLAELEAGLRQVGYPAVLKTAVSGYDGKGQQKINHLDEVEMAWEKVGRQTAVLEAWIDFQGEVSMVAARGADGAFAHYGLIANEHRHHILDVSLAPAPVAASVVDQAVAYTHTLMTALDAVGVLCVEFFLTQDDQLLINEMAPRPHNSGHLTVDACVTSQFEQQLRAICGLPLGDTAYLQPAAMANLLGDLWQDGEPTWTKAVAVPQIKLHLYGKRAARPGRKMGHLTALARSAEEAADLVRLARRQLIISDV